MSGLQWPVCSNWPWSGLTQVQCYEHSCTGFPGLAQQGQKEEPKVKDNRTTWRSVLVFGSQDPFAKKFYMGRYFLPAMNTWCRWVGPRANCAPGDQCLTELGLCIQQNSVFRVRQSVSHFAKEALLPSSVPSPMLSLPAQVHLPRLRELLLDKCLHCLAQVLAWLPSPSLAAFAFCLNVQQVAKAGTGLGHLEQEHRHCIKPSTETQTRPLSGLSQRAVSSKIKREDKKSVQATPTASAIVSNTSLFCIFRTTSIKHSGAHWIFINGSC